MRRDQDRPKEIVAQFKTLTHLGHTQKKILHLLEKHSEYWYEGTLFPKIRLIAKKIHVSPSTVHQALYGRKSSKSGVLGIFHRGK